jgi:MauM/NapG family ferredoxin protein
VRKLRIVTQCLFFVLFVLSFFFATVHATAYWFPSHWFLRLNPLVSVVTTIGARTLFLPLVMAGLIVAVLTVVFGRFFCGFVCPLGAMIDFSDRYVLGKSRTASRRPPRFVQRLKYVLLVAILLLAVVGVSYPLFMDPISPATRGATLVAYPVVRALGADVVRMGRAIGIEPLSTVVVKTPLYYNGMLAAFMVGLVLALGFWDKRFWCQYVCPSGALFGLLSRAPLWRRTTVAERCTSCKRCRTSCPTRAIGEDVNQTSAAECIECGICTELRDGCSRFVFGPPRSAQVAGADLGRRHVVAGVLGGVALVPALRADAIGKRDEHGRLIRPPGAVPEDQFLSQCIACGACMKACPTNALQPCVPSDGFGRLFTPRVVPRIGGCEEKCHLCGYVCPTGAIRKLPLEEKRYVKIGTAVIDRHRCLAWSQNKECLVCDEICPYNAIEARVVETTKGLFKVPVVFEDYCLGCGMCEQHCPINDTAAIVVYKFGRQRLAAGNYTSANQKGQIRERRRKSDAHLSVGAPSRQEQGLPPGFATEQEQPGRGSGSEGGLPPGFVE